MLQFTRGLKWVESATDENIDVDVMWCYVLRTTKYHIYGFSLQQLWLRIIWMHWTWALLLLRWVLLPDKGLLVVAQRSCNTKLTKVWQIAWPMASLPRLTTISFFQFLLFFSFLNAKSYFSIYFDHFCYLNPARAIDAYLFFIYNLYRAGIVIQNSESRLLIK